MKYKKNKIMKHLKIYEEYKYFRARKDRNSYTRLSDGSIGYYSGTPNEYDPNEPFWNWKKKEYSIQKNATLDKERVERGLANFGVTEEIKTKILQFGSVRVSNDGRFDKGVKFLYMYSKEEIKSIFTYIEISYFEQENDYIAEVVSEKMDDIINEDPPIYRASKKKRFEDLNSAIDWSIRVHHQVIEESIQKERDVKANFKRERIEKLRGGLTEKFKNKK